MASYPNSSPRRRESTNNINKDRNADTDLSHTLRQLSLSGSPSPVRSPLSSPRPGSAARPAISRSPSVASNRGAPRSPLNGSLGSNGRDSRSATPTLLRKASSNSLHSASGVAPLRRASSANLMSPSALRSPLGSMTPEVEEKPAVTAASIANAYFKAELDLHHGDSSNAAAETVVILHDNCYGHRYSRPRTSKTALSTIVERPERIKASVTGIAVAYVRLGERHAGGMHPLHPKLDPASIPSVPFRIQKTARRLPLMSQAVTHVHGTKWMEELKIMCDSAETKLAMNGKELQRPDIQRGAEDGTPKKLHEGDLYLCAESLDALEGALGGVCEAVDAVFKPAGPKRAFVAIRPPGHHCSASFPSGFCWLNNVHVGIMHGILSHGLTHAAILDFDLHHGDGSQSITWQHNARGQNLRKNDAWWKKTSIGYFSLHDINSYPCEYGDEDKVRNASICIDNAHGQNIWNVHLEPWKTEADFWRLYESKYAVLLEKTRKFLHEQTERVRSSAHPGKGAIFLSAGFDASEWEGAGMQRHSVNVPTGFYARITRDVIKIAAEEGTSVEGRIVSVLEGGYSDRALFSGLLSHISGLAGEDPIPTKEEDYNGLGFEMGQKIGSVRSRGDSLSVKNPNRPYEPSWWSVAELERMEAAMAPPPTEPKQPRTTVPPTYSSPTQSSQAKVSKTPKIRRSMSGLSSLSNGSPLSRPPSPPPPDVPWTTAAHELTKLLIPSSRQTDSCTHEELSAEATRARRDRQSMLSQSLPLGTAPPIVAPAPNAPVRVSMRERKPVKPFGAIDEEDEERKNRRKTVAGHSVFAGEKAPSRSSTPNPSGRPKQPGRRLSAASTIVSDPIELDAPQAASTNGSTSPTTAYSGRPDSAMSGAASSGAPLAVKKTRNVTTVKKEGPKAPRGGKKLATTAGAKTSMSAQASPIKSADKTGDDMDKLTSGMKKIKINVVTPAQKEARERAKKQQAEREATGVVKQENSQLAPMPNPAATPITLPPSEPRDVASPSGTSLTTPTTEIIGLEQFHHPTPEPSHGPTTPRQEEHPFLPPLEPYQLPLPASSPIAPSTPLHQTSLQPSAAPTIFVPYQPEGATPEAIPQNQPLQWLPPNNTVTPSPMKRTDLPVFTSTSAIRFAPHRIEEEGPMISPKAESPVKSEVKEEESVWEIPETPQK